VFLVNSRFPLVCATSSSSGREALHPNEVILLPKLRMYFAEFLNHSSPDRLGILYLPTCVGLGYGHRANSPLSFSRQHGISDFACIGSASRLGVDSSNSHRSPPTRLPQDNHRLGSPTLLRPSSVTRVRWVGSLVPKDKQPLSTRSWAGRGHGGTGISTGCASTTPLGLALAPDLPWAD
jgi:hypothetical protein